MKRLLLLCLCLSGVFAFVLPVASGHADEAATPPSAADSEGFVPDRRPVSMANVEEGLPAGPLVAAAYGFIWVAALVFVGRIARRASQLETEMAQLAERLPPVVGSRVS
jgi:hypothetical protein